MDDTQAKYEALFSGAYDRALSSWLDDDDPRHGYDFEQNGKAVAEALANTWTDEIETSEHWAARAVMRFTGK